MPFYKFAKNDVFYNRIKTHPDVQFHIWSGSIFYANHDQTSSNWHTPRGNVNLYELNVQRNSSGHTIAAPKIIYPWIHKASSLISFKTVETGKFNNEFNFGDVLTSSYPMTSTLAVDHFNTRVAPATEFDDRRRVMALKNTLNYYNYLSPRYSYSSSYGDKSSQELQLISIPSIFYGSGIKKGSVNLKYYMSGTLIGHAVDANKNGELIEKTGSSVGKCIGMVLYNEGFILLTGSANLSTKTELFKGPSGGLDEAKWIYFGTLNTSVLSSSYDVNFKGTEKIPTIMMHAQAPKGFLNHSNNPTFLKHYPSASAVSSSTFFIEHDKAKISNTVSSSFPHHSASFDKQTFISKIGIYDEKKNLIAIANLARPVKKTHQRDFTFRMKLDV